jgi:hypothetical protein
MTMEPCGMRTSTQLWPSMLEVAKGYQNPLEPE